MKTNARVLGTAVCLMVAPVQAQETKVTIGGFAKLDVLVSRFSEAEVAQSTARDFYVPSSIPVSFGGGESYTVLDMHAKETRLFIKTDTDFGADLGPVSSHIELDFISGVVGGNENVTNAYNPALRRAFITVGNWLLGQEWTTFQNLGSIPDTLDFVAWPSEGTVFGRQPMIRYKAGFVELALENRETTVLANGAAATVATGDGVLPDVVSRIKIPVGDSEFVIAALARQLAIDNAAAVMAGPVVAIPAGTDDETFGGGISLSGKIALGKDDLRFMFTAGEGIGRYVALGTATDAVLDVNNELEPIAVAAGYMAFRHFWSDRWRSTVTASGFSADNETTLTGVGVTRQVFSGSVNLLYSPVPKLTVGVEYRHAERETEAGADGALDRVQFATKYTF